MKNHNFFLNGEAGENSFTLVFKQPLMLKPNDSVVFNMANVQFSPQAGYLKKKFAVMTDLPIKTFHTKPTAVGSRTGVEDRILAFLPPNNRGDDNMDDPGGGLPGVAGRTYEPYQPVVHHLENNPVSLNAINFRIVDGETLEPFPNITHFSLSLTIMCH